MSYKIILTIGTAIFSAVAAILWLISGMVKVSPKNADLLRKKHFKKHGPTGYAKWTLLDGSDFEFTLSEQSKWNRRAAFAACIAACLQAISTLAFQG